MQAGALYVVATPIGNLGDITRRAIDTLRDCDRVVAEDTRRTRALLSHLGIAGKPVDRIDAHASDADVARVVAALSRGENVALCTDAGTPVVSDPGAALVRAAADAGARVVPIPGASALLAAAAASGLVDGGFRFVGFLPREGSERRAALAAIQETPEAVVLFEAPTRTAKTLADLAEGMPGRAVAVCRELTKAHEEVLRGSIAELAKSAAEREWLGEVTMVIGPREAEVAKPSLSDDEILARIDAELATGRRAKDVADAIAFATGLSRRDAYARVVARRRR